MRRAYKFRAYPTGPQEARATRLLADHCDLYNAALEERREAWRLRQATITYGTQSAQLQQIRRADVNAARNVYARAGLGSGQASQRPEKLSASADRAVT